MRKVEDKKEVFDVIGENGLFSVKKQSRKLSERDLNNHAVIPVYSSQSTNNGVMGFTPTTAEFTVKEKPLLIFGDHTRSMDIAQYSFSAADNVKILVPQNMTIDTLLYVACAWKKRIPDMGYARHWRKAKTVGIELPIIAHGTPNYDYMTRYISDKRAFLVKKYRNYVKDRVKELENVDCLESLRDKKWDAVYIVDIFELVRGREGNMAMLENGLFPLISAKNSNNGLKGFVKTLNKTVSGNCITLNNDGDGGAGLAYYQPTDMALDTHVTALIPKIEMSKWTLLFISECVSKLHGFFGHGLSISNKRAEKIRIMLPFTNDGKPDYAYMEQYAKSMMLKKYKQYLAFLDTKEK